MCLGVIEARVGFPGPGCPRLSLPPDNLASGFVVDFASDLIRDASLRDGRFPRHRQFPGT